MVPFNVLIITFKDLNSLTLDYLKDHLLKNGPAPSLDEALLCAPPLKLWSVDI